MKIAKADLVPKDTNLRERYASFAEFEAACEEFCDRVNTRVHRVTRRVPVEMLAEEHSRLHPIPLTPHTVAFGVTRTVPPRRRWSPSMAGSTPSPPGCSVKSCGSASTDKEPTR